MGGAAPDIKRGALHSSTTPPACAKTVQRTANGGAARA